jgi:hypothetical protein
MKKSTTIIVIVVLIVAIAIYFFTRNKTPGDVGPEPTPSVSVAPSPTASTTVTNPSQTVIGKSVQGNDIIAYHFGTGENEVLLVGGIHGGYEWNTVLVAEETRKYLAANPSAIPENVKVTVIPVLNPDGLKKVVGTTTGNFTQAQVPDSETTVVSGRFNGNTVDLNRNFDCDWQASGKWQSRTVSGGTEAFSEPEAMAIKNYVETAQPDAVLVWYSAAGGVYASNCHTGVSAETAALTNAVAKASGYSAHESFDFYTTTGDMTNWLAKIAVPAVSILLTNHSDIEWTKNLAGVKALLEYYAD